MSRYFWLKMRRDFFKRHDIRIIEASPDGDKLLLFYLKLLTESVDHDGALRYSASKPYTPEMLATITNTTAEFAAQALEVLADLELIKDEPDGTITLPHAVEMIGSNADNDNALRQARYRAKNRNSNAINNASITDSNGNSNAIVTGCVTKNNESKSKSKSKSKSIEKEYTEKDEPARVRFVAPTHDEILDYMTSYCFEKQYDLNPVLESEKFFNYYTSNNWRVGRNKMKDYKAAARSWLLRAKDYVKPSPANNPFEDLVEGNF